MAGVEATKRWMASQAASIESQVQDHEARLSKLHAYRQEYTDLHATLSAVPDRASRDMLVPLGAVAFMPGRLVHTNEVTVLLGDNYFVERSAKQACEILARRRDEVSKLIKEQDDAVSVLVEKKVMTKQLCEHLTPRNSQGEELVDICELASDPPEPEPAASLSANMSSVPTASSPAPLLAGHKLYGMTPKEFVDMLPTMEISELRSALDDAGLPQPPRGSGVADRIRASLRHHFLGGGGDGVPAAAGAGGGDQAACKLRKPTSLERSAATGDDETAVAVAVPPMVGMPKSGLQGLSDELESNYKVAADKVAAASRLARQTQLGSNAATSRPVESSYEQVVADRKVQWKMQGDVRAGDFIPAEISTGPRPGYKFCTGEHGRGWYRDGGTAVATAREEAPKKVSFNLPGPGETAAAAAATLEGTGAQQQPSPPKRVSKFKAARMAARAAQEGT